jgi:hypothetical protein
MTALSWTPRDGETVHLRRDNAWSLPAGRYILGMWRIGRWPGKPSGKWDLRTQAGPMGASLHVPAAQLLAAEAAGILTPISAAELERERLEVQLRVRAPLRGDRRGPMLRQHDASDLALFRAACEPRFI